MQFFFEGRRLINHTICEENHLSFRKQISSTVWINVSFVTETLANKLQLCINMGIFSALFGKKESVDLGQLIKNGAMIIDVRTAGEFSTGHIKGAKNIPLDKLMGQINKIKKDQVIITCCASGMRSASAKGILKKAGYENVHNGGSWTSLRKYFN